MPASQPSDWYPDITENTLLLRRNPKSWAHAYQLPSRKDSYTHKQTHPNGEMALQDTLGNAIGEAGGGILGGSFSKLHKAGYVLGITIMPSDIAKCAMSQALLTGGEY